MAEVTMPTLAQIHALALMEAAKESGIELLPRGKRSPLPPTPLPSLTL